jgi:hypothetical protein
MDSAALDDDFAAAGPRGFVLNREQWLDRYRSDNLKNEAFAWQDVSVRQYGEAAVGIGIQMQQAAYQGHAASGRFRVSHVYVRKGDRWLIASIQLSGPIPEAPPGLGKEVQVFPSMSS